MLALARFFYLIAGSCALYVSLAPYFSSWHGSPSLFSLAYWICAILLLIAAILPPGKHSATLALISSAFLSTRLGFGLMGPVPSNLGLSNAPPHAVASRPPAFSLVHTPWI